jgi:hypothetical protein
MKQNTKRTHAARNVAAATASNDTATPAYSPEVEARRADYETLAASFLAMIDLDMNHVNPHLDVKSQYTKDEDHVLMTAVDRHIQLAFHNVDWYAAEAMRLYVEMRLLADEQTRGRGIAYRKVQAEEEGKGS